MRATIPICLVWVLPPNAAQDLQKIPGTILGTNTFMQLGSEVGSRVRW